MEHVSNITNLLYVFFGEEASALREEFLRPYNVEVLTNEGRIFNFRLSRSRRVVENVFGTLVAIFVTFKANINLQPHNIGVVVTASCVLRTISCGKHPLGSQCFDMEDAENGTIIFGFRTGSGNMTLPKGKS
jgi:hypothetical protein